MVESRFASDANKVIVRQPISGLGYGRGYIVSIARIEVV